MMQSLQIRQPYDDPTYPGSPSTTPSVRTIIIRHPGYDDVTNILFLFDAYDGGCGIHYQTAHVACAIITGNKWEGYFSTDVEGLQRAELITQDALLVEDTYYFHVPGEILYAVVPTFANWSFPHKNLPAAWRCPPTTTSFPAYLNVDRDRCSLTRATLRVETAHIVPANPSDVKWWSENGMSLYAEHNSTQNTIRFRVDVHQLFDRKPRFAVVPKKNTLVAHIFRATQDAAEEAVRLYHNVPLQFLERAQMEFLLARLAWTVFPYLEIFLTSRKRRKISRIGENGVRVVEELDGDKCNQIYAQSTGRSISPRKRNIGQVNSTIPTDGDGQYDDESATHNDYESATDNDYESATDNDYESATDNDDEYQRRGRTRRRSSKVFYTSDSTSRRLYRSGSEMSISKDASLLARLQTLEEEQYA